MVNARQREPQSRGVEFLTHRYSVYNAMLSGYRWSTRVRLDLSLGRQG